MIKELIIYYIIKKSIILYYKYNYKFLYIFYYNFLIKFKNIKNKTSIKTIIINILKNQILSF